MANIVPHKSRVPHMNKSERALSSGGISETNALFGERFPHL